MNPSPHQLIPDHGNATNAPRQLPTEGTLQLSYKAGELLAPKQSLLLEAVQEKAPPATGADDTSQHISATHNAMRPGVISRRPSTGGERVDSAEVDDRSHNADERASSSRGFQALIYMLRSLGSPIQVKSRWRRLAFCPSPAAHVSALKWIIFCTFYRVLAAPQ